MAVPHTHTSVRRLSLRTIAVAALLVNALTFLLDIATVGPNEINVSHAIMSSVAAGIVALRFRWTPAIGALVCAVMLVEIYVFALRELTEPASAASFATVAVFVATSVVGLVSSIGATVQAYRTPLRRPLVDPPAPRWAAPALLAFTALTLGGILTTAVQPQGAMPGLSPETLAALPALKASDFTFDQRTITAEAGETVVLRLDNADTSTHYLDIDELAVHAIMPPGTSNVAIFTPTQPGTYTFYCQPHADKAAGTGMVGTLVVAP